MARDIKDTGGGRETGRTSRQRIRIPIVPGTPVVRTTRASRLRTSKQVTCSLLDLDEHGVDTCNTKSEVTLTDETSMRSHSRASAGSLKNKAVVPMLKAAYSPLDMFSPEPSMLSIAYRDDGACLYFRQAVSSTTCSKNKDKSMVIKPASTKNENISAAISPDSIVCTNYQKEILKTPSPQHSRRSKALVTQKASPVMQQVDTVQSPTKSSNESNAVKPEWRSSPIGRPVTTKATDKHTEDQTTKPFVNLPRQRNATSPQTTRPEWRSSPIRRPIRIKNADEHIKYETTKPLVDLPSQRKTTSPQTSRPAWRSSPIRRPVRIKNADEHTKYETTKPFVDLPSQRKATSRQSSRPAWRTSPVRRLVTTKTLDKRTEDHTTKPFVDLPSQKKSTLQEKPKPVRMPKIAPIVRTTRAARLRITMKKQHDSEKPDETSIEENRVIKMTPKPTESQTAGMKKPKPVISDIEHSSTKRNSDVDAKQPTVRNTKASKLHMLKERSQESSRRDFVFGTTAPPNRPNERQQTNKLPEEMKIILPKLRETVDQPTYPYKSTKREFAFGSTVGSRIMKGEISRQTLVKQNSQKGKLPEVRTTKASNLRLMREHEAAISVKSNKPDFAFGTRAPQRHKKEISQTKALPQQRVNDFEQYSPQPTSISSRSSDGPDFVYGTRAPQSHKKEITQTKALPQQRVNNFEQYSPQPTSISSRSSDGPDFAYGTRASQSYEKEISQTKALPQQRVNDFEQYSPQSTSISSRSSDGPYFAFGTRASQRHEKKISQTKFLPQQKIIDFEQYSPQSTSISSRSSDEYDLFDVLDKGEIYQIYKQMDEELNIDFDNALEIRDRKIIQLHQDKGFFECLVDSALKRKQEKIRQSWLEAMNQKFSCIMLGVDLDK